MQILYCEIDMRVTELIEAERQELWKKKILRGEKNISIQVLLKEFLKVQLHVFLSQLCA